MHEPGGRNVFAPQSRGLACVEAEGCYVGEAAWRMTRADEFNQTFLEPK